MSGFRSTTVPTGLGLARSVLGAGMLISPPVIAGVAGHDAPTAWLVHLAGGVLFSGLVALLAYCRARPESLPEIIGGVLGDSARRAVLVLYLVGFTVGQAMIAMAAGGFAVTAAGGTWPVLVAVALIVACTVAAGSRMPFGEVARWWRFGVTGAAAVLVAAYPQGASAAGLLPPHAGDDVPLAILLLFFAGVGWESTTRTAPALDRPADVVRAVAAGGAVVAVVYLALAWSMPVGAAPGAAPGGWTRAAGPAIAVILGAYCVTNIRTAAACLTALGGPGPRRAAHLVGLGCLVTLVVAGTVGWTVRQLLVGPGVAVWAVYVVALFAVVRAPRAVGTVGTARMVGTARTAGTGAGRRWYAAGAWTLLAALTALIAAVAVT